MIIISPINSSANVSCLLQLESDGVFTSPIMIPIVSVCSSGTITLPVEAGLLQDTALQSEIMTMMAANFSNPEYWNQSPFVIKQFYQYFSCSDIRCCVTRPHFLFTIISEIIGNRNRIPTGKVNNRFRCTINNAGPFPGFPYCSSSRDRVRDSNDGVHISVS